MFPGSQHPFDSRPSVESAKARLEQYLLDLTYAAEDQIEIAYEVIDTVAELRIELNALTS